MFEILFVGVLLGGCVALIRRGRTPKTALPAPGGPPADRGEAVRRILKHMQRKTIAELTEGSAAVVVGTVYAMPGWQPLSAPMTGTQCIGYHVIIRTAPLGEWTRPVTLHEEARCVALEVRDETGSILVDPSGLELAITSVPYRRDPPHPQQVFSRVPFTSSHVPITVEEGVLQPGSQILVCGVVARELAASDYRDGDARLLLRASATFPLVASSDADLLTPGERLIAPEEVHRRKR